MSEAVGPITRHAFLYLGFESLRFSNAQENDRSRRIKEKMVVHFVGLEPRKAVDPPSIPM